MSSDKEVTIYDIARKLNISAATVSRGLQDHPGISKRTKKLIFDLVEELGLSQKAGQAAAEQILKWEKLPDGVFAANDTSAVACLLELKKKGIKIPNDIAIVGFNNDPIATVVEPNLSTVNYSGYDIGEVAARHLINHLSGISPINNTVSIIIRADFIERASSQKNKN